MNDQDRSCNTTREQDNFVNCNKGVNKSEVQGSSFEVGAMVTYEGREMTVSQAPDDDGLMNLVDISGILALAAALPECKSLRSLKCAAASP